MRQRISHWFVVAAVGLSLSGCSLMVMTQKMLFGDPLLSAEFTQFTHVDLTKGKHRLLIVCETPAAIESELSTLRFDIIDGVTRQLKREGVSVVEPDKVADWLDEHGGLPNDPSELARDFEADYIAWIDIDEFGYREEGNQALLRGKSLGTLRVFRVAKLDDQRLASAVYSKEFTSTYPAHAPISEVNHTAESFRREFTHRVSDEIAHKFYDHRPGWDI
jgi:hypothetical protein